MLASPNYQFFDGQLPESGNSRLDWMMCHKYSALVMIGVDILLAKQF